MLSAQITNIGNDCFHTPISSRRDKQVFCASLNPQGKLHPVCTYTFSIINHKIKKFRTQVLDI